MDYLAIAKKAKTEFRKTQADKQAAELPTSDITDGGIIAVLIDSPIVGPLWFALDDDFQSGDDIPVFFAGELPYLKKMTAQELRQRYTEKLALGGGWVRDRIEGPTRH
jgi:hypothetical protein